MASDSVPEEVRDWLATTFTRSLAAKAERNEKRKFRNVAQALRFGIHVDKLRRTPSSIGLKYPPKVIPLLRRERMDSWNYDVFELNEATNNQVYDSRLLFLFISNGASLELFWVALNLGNRK